MAKPIETAIFEQNQKAADAQAKLVKLQEDYNKLKQQEDELSKKISKKHKDDLETVKAALEIRYKEKQNAEKLVTQETFLLNKLKTRKDYLDAALPAIKSFGDEYKKLAPEIKKQLEADKTKGASYKDLSVRAAQLRTFEKMSSGAASEEFGKKAALMEAAAEAEMDASKEAAKEKYIAIKGEEAWNKKVAIEKIQAIQGLHENDKKRLIESLEVQERLNKKAEVYTELGEKAKGIIGALPEDLQTVVEESTEFAKSFKNAAMAGGPLLATLVLVAAAIGAGLKSFLEYDKATEDFRQKTGYVVGQYEELNHIVHENEVELRKFGVTLEDTYEIANELKNVFGDVAHISEGMVASLSVMTSRLGISADEAAQLQGTLETAAGLSANAASSVGLQVAEMSKMAGVSPKEVLQDIAKSAETTSKFFKGDVNLLKQQVVEAHRLGTDLDKVSATAEKLLDFEGGIENELKAATFVGGQFNLSRARALAMEGKIVDAQKETLAQIQRSGDFRQKDYFTQKALAEAAGISVGEINKQLNIQEKLSHLSGEDLKNAQEAINKGLDVTDLNDEQLKQKAEEFAQNNKIQGTVSDIKNVFESIMATVGGSLIPAFKVLGEIMKVVFFPIQLAADGLKLIFDYSKFLIPVAMVLAGIYAEQLGMMLGTAIAAIASTFSEYPLGLGIPAGLAVIGGISAMVKSAKHVGDVVSPAGGSTQISTKEGGLLQLSPNDDLVAAPGAASALKNAAVGGNSAGNGMAVLASKLDSMVNAIANKSNDIYMDGTKVTAGIAVSVGKSTRNNYTLA